MERHRSERLDRKHLGFPVTLEPRLVYPEPPVVRYEPKRIEHHVRWTQRLEDQPLPVELVIRELLDLNCHDGDAVIEFMRNYGFINRPYPLSEKPHPAVIQLPDTQNWLHDAQRAALTWIAWKDDERVCGIWFGEPERGTPRKTLDSLEEDAWVHFTSVLNDGMSAFPPRARTTMNLNERKVPVGELEVGLFSALCLQLWNLIVEDPPLLRCANEGCRRRFVRQRGGAKAGQYRTKGVMYCTPACAQAQKQREYRRRKAGK